MQCDEMRVASRGQSLLSSTHSHTRIETRSNEREDPYLSRAGIPTPSDNIAILSHLLTAAMGIRLSKRRRSNTRRPSTLRIDGALRTSSNGASSSTPRRPLNLIASGPSSSVPRRPSSSASSTTSYRSCCSLESFYSLPTTPLPDLDEIYKYLSTFSPWELVFLLA